MLQKVLRGLKKTLTTNIQLKIFSLFLAVVLWMVVVNIEDPEQTRNFDIPVSVSNASILTANNQYYETTGDTTISIRVSGNRSILDKMSEADFTAVANMENLQESGRIPIEVTANRYGGSVNVVSKNQYLQVKVGNLITQQFVVEAQTIGEPVVGCVIGSITVDPEVVSVTGPQDIIQTIQSAVVKVDVTDANSAVTARSILSYVNQDDMKIDTSKLVLDVSSIAVNVDIESTKTVQLNVETSGTLSDSLKLKGISTNPSAVSVRGPSNILNDMTAITIPDSVINLSEITGSMSTTVDSSAYLPTGVSLLDTTQTTVSINVDVAEVTEREFQILTENLIPRNVAAKTKVSFAKTTFSLTLRGEASVLDAFNPEQLVGYVDCDGLTKGDHSLEVELTLDDELIVDNVENVTVHVAGE